MRRRAEMAPSKGTPYLTLRVAPNAAAMGARIYCPTRIRATPLSDPWTGDRHRRRTGLGMAEKDPTPPSDAETRAPSRRLIALIILIILVEAVVAVGIAYRLLKGRV